MQLEERRLKELLDRIERVLARSGERWLDPATGEECIKADWRPENADCDVACVLRRDRDGAVVVLNAIEMPYCQISLDTGIEPRSDEALANIIAWLDEVEAELE